MRGSDRSGKNAPSCGVVSGIDPRSGRRFVNQVFLGFTGGAGAPTTDGWLTIAHVGNAGLCFIDAVEIEPAIIEASRWFDDVSGRPLDDPRVRLLLDDARSSGLIAGAIQRAGLSGVDVALPRAEQKR